MMMMMMMMMMILMILMVLASDGNENDEDEPDRGYDVEDQDDYDSDHNGNDKVVLLSRLTLENTPLQFSPSILSRPKICHLSIFFLVRDASETNYTAKGGSFIQKAVL